MRKICFGKNITSVNNKMTNLTKDIKDSLKEVYRFPQNLVDISNCFNGCSNFIELKAELPNSIKNMSSSFEGCSNFSKNIAIPLNCQDMSNSFKGTNIKGNINIPKNVKNLRESFKNTKIESVSFDKDIDYFENFQSCFENCETLSSVNGVLPPIQYANSAFKKTGIRDINFISSSNIIENAIDMFESCLNLKTVSEDLQIGDATGIFENCVNLQSVQNVSSNSLNDSFFGCKRLLTVGNIKSNHYFNTWDGCSNLQSVGNISGELYFNNTFNGCYNYSNVIYLHPTSLNIYQEQDYNFLSVNPLKIYGKVHDYAFELKLQNAHKDKGDYISGYCNPDDFDFLTYEGKKYFTNYKGDSKSMVIPRYFRTNLLDETTKYTPMFNNAFNNKIFDNVYIYGGDIAYSFNNTIVDNLIIEPETKINRYAFSKISANNLSILNNGSNISIGCCGFLTSNIKNGFIYSNINTIEDSAFDSVIGNLYFGNINNASGNSVFNNFNGNILSYDKNKNHIINKVGNNAFCNMIGYVYIPIKQIGNNSFRNVKTMKSINLSLTNSIGENAFYNSGIEELNLSDNISLTTNSLHGMNSLVNLNTYNLSLSYFYSYPSSLKNVELRKGTYNASDTSSLKSVESIFMNNSSSIINNYQFNGLTNLKTFRTTSTLPTVGSYGFAYCTNLTGDLNVGNISTNGFLNCSNLQGIYGKTIVDGALSGCKSLKSLSYSEDSISMSELLAAQAKSLNDVFHIGRVFNATIRTNINTTTNTTYKYLGEYVTEDSIYSFLNLSKIPSSLSNVFVEETYWTKGKFMYMNMIENVKCYCYADWIDETIGFNGEIEEMFKGCNNLKNINLKSGMNDNDGYGRNPRISPSILGLSKTQGNYNISFSTGLNRYRTPIFSDMTGNLSISFYILNTASGYRELFGKNWFNNVSAYNYSTNITYLPKITNTNGAYYATNMYTGYSLKTSGITFASGGKYYGAFNGDSRYYYIPKNTQLLGTAPTYNNCVFWIDQFDKTNSVSSFFANTTNSKIYCNGVIYDGGIGTGTKIITKIFNVPDIVKNDVNIDE